MVPKHLISFHIRRLPKIGLPPFSTPSHHPFYHFHGTFHEINHPANLGYPHDCGKSYGCKIRLFFFWWTLLRHGHISPLAMNFGVIFWNNKKPMEILMLLTHYTRMYIYIYTQLYNYNICIYTHTCVYVYTYTIYIYTYFILPSNRTIPSPSKHLGLRTGGSDRKSSGRPGWRFSTKLPAQGLTRGPPKGFLNICLMAVCIHVYIYIYMYTRVCVYIYVCIYIYMYIYIYTYVYVYTYIYMYVYTYVITCISISVYIYIHTHTYVCIDMCYSIYIFMYETGSSGDQLFVQNCCYHGGTWFLQNPSL